jgi:hypothetical protein
MIADAQAVPTRQSAEALREVNTWPATNRTPPALPKTTELVLADSERINAGREQ